MVMPWHDPTVKQFDRVEAHHGVARTYQSRTQRYTKEK
jgi:hypothetical protein